MKLKKLSDTQIKMIKLMREGYELTTCGVSVGCSWSNMVRLTQHNYPKSPNKEVNGNIATVKVLERLDYIVNTTDNPIDSLNRYVLTPKGRMVEL